MVKNDQGQLKNIRENALEILKLWEEKLKINNEINEDMKKSKEKNDSPKIHDSKC